MSKSMGGMEAQDAWAKQALKRYHGHSCESTRLGSLKMSRDDFKPKLKGIVAQRAAYMCSNPDCRKNTIKPHSDPNKSLSDGVAAHICAAAKGGPRYEANQTQTEREGINNAIWLCHNCSDTVDKDEKKYPKELLLEWKRLHEEFILDKGMVASFPDIQLHTQDGFSISPSAPVKITGEYCERYREHTLLISNKNDKILHDLRLRIQFPESIIDNPTVKNSPGVNIVCKPDWAECSAKASGNGSVTVIKKTACEKYVVEIDRLLPRNTIEVRLLSIEKRLHPQIFTGEYLHYFIIGSFQYEWQGTYYKREFFVPLIFDQEQRMVSSRACEDDLDDRKICIHFVA